MAETPDREARLEEIRRAVADEHYLALEGKDVRWLLSEIDRLRGVEREARAAMRILESSGAAWVDREGRQESKTYSRLKAKLEGEDEQD